VAFCSFRWRSKQVVMVMSEHSNRFILPKAGPLRWAVRSAEVTFPESKCSAGVTSYCGSFTDVREGQVYLIKKWKLPLARTTFLKHQQTFATMVRGGRLCFRKSESHPLISVIGFGCCHGSREHCSGLTGIIAKVRLLSMTK
jgi:hypothetical protein